MRCVGTAWDVMSDHVAARYKLGGVGTVLTLIPVPTEHDEFLRQIGISYFIDADDEWWKSFSELLGRIVAGSKEYLANAALDSSKNLDVITISKRLLEAARDDRIKPVVVSLDNKIFVRTGDGLPAVMLAVAPQVDWYDLVRYIGTKMPLERISMTWPSS